MQDYEVIQRFATHLVQCGHHGLKIDEIPDLKERNLPEIDAIAGPFAIEHTSIDTVPNQRRNDDWFLRVIEGLEQELSGSLLFHLFVILEYRAVTTGQDWKQIRLALKNWIVNRAEFLADGDHILDDVSGVPFKLHVHKDTNMPSRLFFARFTPEDNTLSERTQKLLDKKAKKLAKYQLKGKTTVLLVESSDFALMNKSMMRSAIKDTFEGGNLSGVDQIWYAEIFDEDNIKFTDFTFLCERNAT